MFGYRPDGHPIPEYVDPIVQFTPFIMTTRNDAQNTSRWRTISASTAMRRNPSAL